LENAGLCMDPHLGLPYIPGSSLKGIARAAARECNAEPSKIMAVFGWSAGDMQYPEEAGRDGCAGSVAFLPAYPKNDFRLAADVLTCHYPEYYRSAEEVQAMDNEDPLPSFFPAVEPGAIFSFSLVLIRGWLMLKKAFEAFNLPPDFDPLEQASIWLEYGLCELGVGAKTSAGYGWFVREVESQSGRNEAAPELKERERQKKRNTADESVERLAEGKRIAEMSPKQGWREILISFSDEQFAEFAKNLNEKTEDERRAFLDLLAGEKKGRWKVWKKRKPDLAEAIKKIAESMGEVLP